MKKMIGSIALLIAFLHNWAQVPKEKSLLWKIDSKNGSKVSYLYGTMHILCPDDIQLSNTFKELVTSTNDLFLEIDMDDPTMQQKAMLGMMMKDGNSIDKLLDKKDFDSMNVIYKAKAGFPLQMMAKAKPILLMSPLLPSLLSCKLEGIESRLIAMAKEQKKDIKGLETLAYQMSVMDSIPYKEQANMLKQILYNLDSTKNAFTQLANLYKQKDINAMYNLSTQSADFGAYEATMLINRNKNWIPVIEEQVKNTSTFFAVGAAHLGGENGVIALLRKQGYKVTPVKEK